MYGLFQSLDFVWFCSFSVLFSILNVFVSFYLLLNNPVLPDCMWLPILKAISTTWVTRSSGILLSIKSRYWRRCIISSEKVSAAGLYGCRNSSCLLIKTAIDKRGSSVCACDRDKQGRSHSVQSHPADIQYIYSVWITFVRDLFWQFFDSSVAILSRKPYWFRKDLKKSRSEYSPIWKDCYWFLRIEHGNVSVLPYDY